MTTQTNLRPIASFELADPAATETLGAQLASALRDRGGWVVFLSGELGAGKTTLVRAWLRVLGVRGTIRSPTYTLIEPYESMAAACCTSTCIA